mmetsp:Transcript_108780/g.313422  ORF Transcript_108780/g.313422 Transcript_108780/m.313422 type:complete len:409 (-) Transcript_108780:41-1267(-)
MVQRPARQVPRVVLPMAEEAKRLQELRRAEGENRAESCARGRRRWRRRRAPIRRSFRRGGHLQRERGASVQGLRARGLGSADLARGVVVVGRGLAARRERRRPSRHPRGPLPLLLQQVLQEGLSPEGLWHGLNDRPSEAREGHGGLEGRNPCDGVGGRRRAGFRPLRQAGRGGPPREAAAPRRWRRDGPLEIRPRGPRPRPRAEGCSAAASEAEARRQIGDASRRQHPQRRQRHRGRRERGRGAEVRGGHDAALRQRLRQRQRRRQEPLAAGGRADAAADRVRRRRQRGHASAEATSRLRQHLQGRRRERLGIFLLRRRRRQLEPAAGPKQLGPEERRSRRQRRFGRLAATAAVLLGRPKGRRRRRWRRRRRGEVQLTGRLGQQLVGGFLERLLGLGQRVAEPQDRRE